MPHLETADKSLIYRYGKTPKPIDPGPENPTPKRCRVCQELMYSVLYRRNIVYRGCRCKTARPYRFSPPKK